MPAFVPEGASLQPAETPSSQVDERQLTSALEKLDDSRRIEPIVQPTSVIEKTPPSAGDTTQPSAQASKLAKTSTNPGDGASWEKLTKELGNSLTS